MPLSGIDGTTCSAAVYAAEWYRWNDERYYSYHSLNDTNATFDGASRRLGCKEHGSRAKNNPNLELA
jgi:hypothetical protein